MMMMVINCYREYLFRFPVYLQVSLLSSSFCISGHFPSSWSIAVNTVSAPLRSPWVGASSPGCCECWLPKAHSCILPWRITLSQEEQPYLEGPGKLFPPKEAQPMTNCQLLGVGGTSTKYQSGRTLKDYLYSRASRGISRMLDSAETLSASPALTCSLTSLQTSPESATSMNHLYKDPITGSVLRVSDLRQHPTEVPFV